MISNHLVIPSSWRHLEHIVWWCSFTRIGEGNVHQRPCESLLSNKTSASLDAPGVRHGKSTFTVELAQAFSRSQCHALRCLISFLARRGRRTFYYFELLFWGDVLFSY